MEISIQKSRKSPGCIDERWRMIEGRSCCEKERDTVREREREQGEREERGIWEGTARKGEEEKKRERREEEEESGAVDR